MQHQSHRGTVMLSALTQQCTNTASRQPANLNHNVILKMMMAFSVGHTCLLWGDSLKTVEAVKVGRHIRSNSSKHVFSTVLGGQRERWGEEEEMRREAAGEQKSKKSFQVNRVTYCYTKKIILHSVAWLLGGVLG